jgi:hypothetical protein
LGADFWKDMPRDEFLEYAGSILLKYSLTLKNGRCLWSQNREFLGNIIETTADYIQQALSEKSYRALQKKFMS